MHEEGLIQEYAKKALINENEKSEALYYLNNILMIRKRYK